MSGIDFQDAENELDGLLAALSGRGLSTAEVALALALAGQPLPASAGALPDRVGVSELAQVARASVIAVKNRLQRRGLFGYSRIAVSVAKAQQRALRRIAEREPRGR